MDPISFGQIWPRTVASVRRHGDMLWSLAAAFLFLPQLLFARQMNDRPPEQWFKGELAIGDGVAVALVVLCSILSQIMMARLLVRDGTGGQPLGQDGGGGAKRLPQRKPAEQGEQHGPQHAVGRAAAVCRGCRRGCWCRRRRGSGRWRRG